MSQLAVTALIKPVQNCRIKIMRFLQLCSAIENKVSHYGRIRFPFSSPQSQYLWSLKKENAYYGGLFGLLNLAKILEAQTRYYDFNLARFAAFCTPQFDI